MIKSFRTRGTDFMLPDRNAVTMTVPFMRAYTELLVKTCHTRGAHAIGGMAAFIPSQDAEVNEAAFAKVRDDKTREANDGFDGSWVAHPGMVEVCKEVFTSVLGDRPNQLDRTREDVQRHRRAAARRRRDARRRHRGGPAEQHLAWASSTSRRGSAGSAPSRIFNLMEDAATAEISRSQVWQWLHNDVDARRHRPPGHPRAGRPDRRGGDRQAARATRQTTRRPKQTFLEVAVADDYADFLTLPAYERMP